MMEIYLVGGAIRDKLLDLPIKERDWVVVGSTPDEMLALGYKQVGKDFPVFLHPKSQEEYALARTERKTGKGYTGFICDAAASVTLEDDLKRRDLTINAIAEDQSGQLIDPYGGQADLQKRILRHVSPAFVEDPVRLLRVARFAARFKYLGFNVAIETMMLMQTMVANGEITALVPERVWQELDKALATRDPQEFFIILEKTRALAQLFPVFNSWYEQHVKQVDMARFKQTLTLYQDKSIRFSVLVHGLSEEACDTLCTQYRVPKHYQQLARLTIKYYPQYLQADALSATELLNILINVDAIRREERFYKWLQVCQAVALFRRETGSADMADYLRRAQSVLKAIDIVELTSQGLDGQKLAEAIVEKRLEVLTGFTSA